METPEARAVINSNIEKFGCHLVTLEPDNYLPGFVYSIGMFKKFGHPEMICFGLKADVAASIINGCCKRIEQGTIFTEGKLYSGFLQDFDIMFVKVNKEYYHDYLGYGGWFYDMSFDFPVLQIVWPDKQSRFPWEPDFNPDWKFKQPLLDRNMDFKFYEERDLGIFTSRQALEGAPVLYVYHNDDGDWQFHTSAEPDLDDARIVCLEEMTTIDPTINELYHLQFGWSAWRKSREDAWEYAEDSKEE
jgi:hypothetical protein